MEQLAIFFEFLYLILPFLAGIAVYIRFYPRKAVLYDFFFILLRLLTLVSVIATIKVMLIIGLGFNQLSFLIGNLSIFLIVGVFIIITIRLLKKPQFLKISTKHWFILITLLLMSLSTKDIIKGLDFFTYSIILLFVDFIVVVLYEFKKEKNTRYFVLFQVPVLVLLSDSILKFLYYQGILSLFPTIDFSLGLRILGLSFLIYLAYLTGNDFEKKEIAPEIITARKRSMFRATFVTVLINIVVITLSFNLFFNIRDYRTKTQDHLQLRLAIYAYDTGIQASRLLEYDFYSHIKFLSQEEEILNPLKRNSEIDKFYSSHSKVFSSVTLMNTKGIIEYTVPFITSIGADISSQPHVVKVLKEKVDTLSEPFMSTQGFPAIALHIPLFDENKNFVGTIAGVLDLRTIPSLLQTLPQEGKSFLIFENGVLLASNSSEFSVLENIKNIVNESFNNRFFTSKFSFPYLENNFEIYSITDKASINSEINQYIINRFSQYLPEALILFLVLGIFLSIIKREGTELGEKVEEAITREKQEKKSREEFQSKLNEVNMFVYNISPFQSENSLAKALTDITLSSIKNADRATFFVRKKDMLVPLAASGYDVSSLADVRIPLKIEETRWKTDKPQIVRNIYKTTPVKELKAAFDKTGSFETKESIVVLIKSEKDYFGTIYIDSTKGYGIFTEDDLKIAGILSKIAKFYFENKNLLDQLKDKAFENMKLTEKLQKLISLTSKITFLENEDSFFSELLEISCELIEHGDKGSVLIRNDNYLNFIAAKGYPLDALKKISINIETELDVTGGGKEILINKILEKASASFTNDQLKAFEAIGSFSIKSTITAPIFLDNEYFGGIFIDSTKGTDVFTDEDRKVIKAISNIASLYERTRKLIKEVEKNTTLSKLAVEILKKVEDVQDREKLIQNILFEINKNVPLAINEVCNVSSISDHKYICSATHQKTRIKEIKEIPYLINNLKDATLIKSHLGDFSKLLIDKKISSIFAVPQSKNLTIFYSFKREISDKESEILKSISFDISEIITSKELSFEIIENYLETLIITVKTIDSRDPYTKAHSENVTKYIYLIGKKMGIPYVDLKTLTLSALLHDIGKIGIPDSILRKNGALTEEEYDIIKKHPVIGWEMLKEAKLFRNESEFILHHHEWFDGRGYPSGLKGYEIPLYSRIIAVADAFDAMTTERPYRRAKTINEAKEELIQLKQKQFDPEIVDEFLGIDIDISNLDLLEILREVFQK